MKLLVPYECHLCGEVNEAEFLFSGPHIKQICYGCKSYVKFFPISKLPDIKEIKLNIWSITKNVEQIESHKKKIGFIESSNEFQLTNIEQKIMYWRLYLSIKGGSL